MKRWTALLLMLGLLTGPGLPAILAEGETLHTLWDIPFGTPLEECKALLEERTGTAYDLLEDGGALYLETAPDHTVTCLDLPATLMAYSAPPENSLYLMELHFAWHTPKNTGPWAEALPETLDGLLEQYEALRQQLAAEYGPCTGMLLSYSPNLTDTETAFDYYVPMKDGAIDYDEIRALLLPGDREVALCLYWDNVQLRCYAHPLYMDGHLLANLLYYQDAPFTPSNEGIQAHVQPEV